MKHSFLILAFLSLSVTLTCCKISAQDGDPDFECIKIYNKRGGYSYIPLDKIGSISFTKLSYLNWSDLSYSVDTLYMEASAGREYLYYIADANFPISYTSSASWLDVCHIDADDSYKTTIWSDTYEECRMYSQYFYTIAERNDTGKDRWGTVTLSLPDGKELSYQVCQKAYDLRFLDTSTGYIELKDEITTTLAASDTTALAFTSVNYGMSVSEPEWAAVSISDCENITIEEMQAEQIWSVNGTYGWAELSFKPNESHEKRTADVVISGGGKSIVWHIEQSGKQESNLGE